MNAGRALIDEKRHYEIACKENAELRARIAELEPTPPSAPADRAAVLREAATTVRRKAVHDDEDFCLGIEFSADLLVRLADEAQGDLSASLAEGRLAVQTVLAETVAVYAADRLGVSVADVLDAAADASAAERASSRPAGWVQGREWKADLLHQQARELRAGDETQQAGEGDRG
jgi:hypothetical protein